MALEMLQIRIRAITMHFQGICGLKQKLNYPFNIVLQLYLLSQLYFDARMYIDTSVEAHAHTYTHIQVKRAKWGYLSLTMKLGILEFEVFLKSFPFL